MDGDADPLIRTEVVDGRHTVLRATWHRTEGTVVLSLWRHGACIGTFHADRDAAAALADVLAVAAAAPPAPPESSARPADTTRVLPATPGLADTA